MTALALLAEHRVVDQLIQRRVVVGALVVGATGVEDAVRGRLEVIGEATEVVDPPVVDVLRARRIGVVVVGEAKLNVFWTERDIDAGASLRLGGERL